MRMKSKVFMTPIVLALCVSSVWAARNKEPVVVPPVPLTEAGQKLEAQYTAQLEALKADILKEIPSINEGSKVAYLAARQAEIAAEADRDAKQGALGKVGGAVALVNHAKNKWIAGAEKGLAEAEAALQKAATDAERAAATLEVAKWQENKDAGLKALKERQDALDKVTLEEPKLIKDLEVAQTALDKAQADTLSALKALDLEAFLASDKLDPELVKCVVLAEATPNRLAEFASQGKEQEKLIGKLLGDDELLQQMLIADGARDGKYGPAMQIYTDIQKASPKAAGGVLQRLALAVSLEHAVPVKQTNPNTQVDAPTIVDPVKRYLHYEKAFLDGELDPGFKGLSVWDYRFVVDGDEPDEIIGWGREMLRNYRPDHISTPNTSWRYVAAVKTEVQYGSADQKYDRPELHGYQNMIMNGGVCGRRAFFGRFILRAFGVPTTARPQTGHAALVHWTPNGWVACLGAGWGGGTTKTPYKSDLDFLATTQARASEKAYLKVKRAQWVGDVLGETRVYGLYSGTPDLWNGVSLYVQKSIIAEAKAVALAAVGEDIGEANESKEKEEFEDLALSAADKAIVIGNDGSITVPAVACSKPTASTGKIIFQESYLGGKQLHYSRTGTPEDVEYVVDVPAAGKYALCARVVTTSANQHLLVAVNGAKEPADIAVPFTVGMWETTAPVTVDLVQGRNVLQFSRNTEGVKGVTVKDFTLTPVK